VVGRLETDLSCPVVSIHLCATHNDQKYVYNKEALKRPNHLSWNDATSTLINNYLVTFRSEQWIYGVKVQHERTRSIVVKKETIFIKIQAAPHVDDSLSYRKRTRHAQESVFLPNLFIISQSFGSFLLVGGEFSPIQLLGFQLQILVPNLFGVSKLFRRGSNLSVKEKRDKKAIVITYYDV
jgi:hypothetical protein